MIPTHYKILVILAAYCYQESLANPPQSLTAVDITTSSALLIWNPSSSRNVTGYAVYRYNPGSTWLTGIATVNYQTIRYTVSGLMSDTNYCYLVRSYINRILYTSSATSVCFNTPQANPPLSLRVVDITTSSALLIWNPSSSRNVTGYAMYSYNFGSTVLTEIATVNYQTTCYTVSGLMSNTNYCYRVQSYINGMLYTSPATSVCFNTPQAPPSSPTLSSNGITTTSRTANVSWSSCSGANRYYVGYRRLGSSLWTTIETYNTSITIQNLLPSTSYQFRVQCEDSVGRSPFSSTQSKATEEDTIPPMFDTIRLTQMEAHITWNASQQSFSATSYEVMAVTMDNYGNLTNHTCTSTSLSCTINNLTAKSTYVFQIKAVSPHGTSAWSSPVSRNTLPSAPGVVINFTAINRTISSVSVQWMKLNTATDLYKLTIDSGDANDADEVSLVNSAERYTFHDLSPQTDYHITIWAVNKAGSGPVSTVNVTTLPVIVVPTDAPVALIGSTSSLGILLFLLLLSVLVLLLALGCRRLRRKDISSTKQEISNNDVDIETNIGYSMVLQNSCLEKDSLSLSEDVETRRLPLRDRHRAIPTMPKEINPSAVGEPVYAYSEAFEMYSGWFKPSVNEVLSEKLGLSFETFARLGPGIFYFFHETKMNAKYIGCARRLPVTLCGIVDNLYKKEQCDLNPLELELKHFSPSADHWIIQVWQCDKKDLLLERAKMIIQYQTLKPYGLNQRLEITSKEVWDGFSEWYMESKKKK